MPLHSYQEKLIDLYREQELLLHRIYSLLAERYPKLAGFWNEMAREELEHAEWVNYLKKGARAGKVTFVEKTTRTYTVSGYVGYLTETLMKIETGHMPLRAVLGTMADVEKGLIEKEVFRHFEGDSPEVVKFLRILDEGQQAHAVKMQRFAAEYAEKVAARKGEA